MFWKIKSPIITANWISCLCEQIIELGYNYFRILELYKKKTVSKYFESNKTAKSNFNK